MCKYRLKSKYKEKGEPKLRRELYEVNLPSVRKETSHTVEIVTFSTLQNAVDMSKFDKHKTFMADLRQLRDYAYSGRCSHEEMAVALWGPMSLFTSGD